MIQKLLRVFRTLLDAQAVFLQRAAVVAGAIVAYELVLLEQLRVEPQRCDEAIGDSRAMNTKNRLATSHYRVSQFGVAHLYPLVMFDVPLTTVVECVSKHGVSLSPAITGRTSHARDDPVHRLRSPGR